MTLKEQVMEEAMLPVFPSEPSKCTADVLNVYAGLKQENARLLPLIATLAAEIARLRGALEQCEHLDTHAVTGARKILADNQRAMEKVGIKL